MNLAVVGLVFDAIIMVLLAATIVFAAKLSISLKRFKDNRDILDKMIRDLNTNVNDAERVIGQLQNNARETGSDLQRMIDQASALSDELSLMTEAGDNLAGRLEKLAERNSHLAQQSAPQFHTLPEDIIPAQTGRRASPASAAGVYTDYLKQMDPAPAPRKPAPAAAEKTAPEKPASAKSAAPDVSGFFAIRDPDIERGLDPVDGVDGGLDLAEDLHSEAERDLYEALNPGRKKQ